MAKLGSTLMVVIAEAVGVPSCDPQAPSLFADEPVASSLEHSEQGTAKGS